MAELSQRARSILYHAVTEYVATGEPVGSRTLAKKSGVDLSPASIRNVLSDLEEMGYLHQPHTSAGRIPTDRAFRLFIDALMQLQELSHDQATRIRARLAGVEGGGPEMMREAGKMLSELTGTAAVVMAPRVETLALKHLRFIRIGSDELLAVLVMSNGTVHNRFVRASLSENELQKLHNLLDDVIEGRTLGELRDLFARRLAGDRIAADELRRRAFELGAAAVRDAGEPSDLLIEGQDKLLEKPEFADADGVKQIVSALDAREHLVRLLDATLDAKGSMVVVGKEAGDLGGGQLSIVGAAYSSHGHTMGTVGVIGPTRMDYPKVVPLVTATANAMSEMMDKKRSPSEKPGGGGGQTKRDADE